MIDRYSKKIMVPIMILVYFWLSAITFNFTSEKVEKKMVAMPYDTVFAYFFDDRKKTKKKLISSHLIAFCPFVVLLMLGAKERDLHGNARFAYFFEIAKKYKKTGKGIMLGYLDGKKIIIDDSCHVLIKAETRSGKGVSFVVPMFFSWFGSIISLDIKSENYKLTSGFRKKIGQQVVYLNFIAKDGRSDCFNVFDYIPSDKKNRIGFINKIGHYLSPTIPNSDPTWSIGARKLFEGIALLIIDIEEFPATLGQVWRMLNTEQDTGEYLTDLINKYEDILDPVCKMNLYGFIKMPSKTRGGVLFQLDSTLCIFSNPIVDAATSNSSFDIRNVKHKKMSIYVGVPPDYLKEMAIIVNLFFQFAVDMNLEKVIELDEKYKHNCLFLMDEACSIGYMETIASKIEYIAGYGLQLVLIVQSTAQLEGVYKGLSEHIEDNCVIKAYLTPSSNKTAKTLSDNIGYTTTKNKSISRVPENFFAKSKTESDTKRALMLPQEVLELPDNKCLLFIKGVKPILADRIFYYQDKRLKRNVLPPVDIPLLQFEQITEIKSSMKTIEIDIDNINLSSVDSDQVLNDQEVIDAANEYLTSIGVI